LSAIPLASGAFRLVGLGGGPELMPANERFAASPLPVVLHIVSVSIFAILGAFQFSTGLRRGRPGWHRAAGRLVVACGLLVGLSGLWLTLFYSHPDGSQPLLYALRLLFGSAMVVSIVLGFAAILRRDVNRHRAWMTRGYAIGLGAGTQALTLLVGEVILGPPTELSRALLMGAAWVINLGVAEWVIRKRPGGARTCRSVGRAGRTGHRGAHHLGASGRPLLRAARSPSAMRYFAPFVANDDRRRTCQISHALTQPRR
jgi:uncharacterized membrane protein